MIKKTILIVEDSIINRKILVGFLSKDYHCVEAENGQEALDKLYEHPDSFSAIILDLAMPIMNGFSFLQIVRNNNNFKCIPIIVATGSNIEDAEVDTIKLGAWDFINKPYNREIIKLRVQSAIERSQISAFNELKFYAEHDSLTGIYNRRKFVSETTQLLKNNPDKKFVIIRQDIDRFHLVNSFFGPKEGDRLICFIADRLKKLTSSYLCTYCRIYNDIFAICSEYRSEKDLHDTLDLAISEVKSYSRLFDVVIRYGLFFVNDIEDSVYEMLDKAALAAKSTKGDYIHRYRTFDLNMSQSVEEEQRIITKLDMALRKKQFCVYYQPKYSLATNKIMGAEALVRWNDPDKGLIPPIKFIPIIEKNGSITKVDYFVWESVCAQLKEWIKQGIDPFPISVNVSRVHLYNPDVVNYLLMLVQKYDIPTKLLQLELTESAYVGDPELINDVIKDFQGKGFTILMDDFGSGYSSLSSLKNMNVDILKIDMRFFEQTESTLQREDIIIESVVQMANKLNLPVIAEGVETKEQVDFLKKIGCESVQGYYFAKPMPIEEYSKLVVN